MTTQSSSPSGIGDPQSIVSWIPAFAGMTLRKNMSIIFEIATPERVVYKETVDSLTLPTKDGEITVLPNHIPLVSVLVPGVITVRKGKDEQYMAVSGGFIEVQPAQISPAEKLQSGRPITRVVVLADTAERAEELTEAAIEKARADAQQALLEKRGADEESFATAAAALERELARLKVVRKRRHTRGGPIIASQETEPGN